MPDNGRVPYEEIVRRRRLQQDEERLRHYRQQYYQLVQQAQQNAILYGQGNFLVPAPPDAVGVVQAPVAPIPQQEVQEVVPPEDKEMKLINPFLIGCDPEFVAFDFAGKHLNVQNLIPQKGEVGYDHGGDVLEVRPRPAKSSFTLLKHIWGVVKPLKIPATKYRAGAYLELSNRKISLGGHIHLDLPFETKSVEGRYRVLALDEVTSLFEALDILPTKECEKRRAFGRELQHPNYEYGRPGDVRKADTADRTEYRTMASWLYSPITSFLCLTAAKLAAFAPKETVIQLGAGAPSNGKVAKYFEAFAGKDDDAKRVVERVLDRGLKLQRDPDANILSSWKEELKQLAA